MGVVKTLMVGYEGADNSSRLLGCVECVSVASVLRQVAFTQAFAASSRCFGTDDDGVLKVPVCGVP